MHTLGSSTSGFILLFIIQIIFLIVFCFFTVYDEDLLPEEPHKNNTRYIQAGHHHLEEDMPEKRHVPSYPHFQDIHVMIFVGFAFLMTFLKKYGYSATGFNLFVASLVIQWALIARGCFDLENGLIRLSLDDMIGADISAAVVLISMGALLGRITPIQLLFMALIETAVFAANEHLQIELMKITDVGGSITVHAFGAYFGLAVSFMMRPNKDKNMSGKLEGASYTSDIFAMIGTLFLWIFWPSFNSALLDGHEQQRAILNTYLSLAAATVTTFVISALVSHEHKLDMVHIQNSTLAGGVAVGSVCNLLIGAHGAVLIGIIAGIISVCGYRYLTPAITSKLRIHDTCGVHNLHGMPAILSAIFSGIYASMAKEENYKNTLTEIFPAMNDLNSTTMIHDHSEIIGGLGRSAAQQGAYQIGGIALTLIIAIVTGAITGLLLKSPSLRNLDKEEHHDDGPYWELPSPSPSSELSATA